MTEEEVLNIYIDFITETEYRIRDISINDIISTKVKFFQLSDFSDYTRIEIDSIELRTSNQIVDSGISETDKEKLSNLNNLFSAYTYSRLNKKFEIGFNTINYNK